MSYSLPVFGPDIQCPHCHKTIPALTLTDSYLCHRHGAFEANPTTFELVHLQSGRRWRQWEGQWFRQHTHVDGIRFEIHEELDRLHAQGMRATAVTIAKRYRSLLQPYLDRNPIRTKPDGYQLYGLPVSFSPEISGLPQEETTGDRANKIANRWDVINFELARESGNYHNSRYPFLSSLFDHKRD